MSNPRTVEDIPALVSRLAGLLQRRRLLLSTAESCTGGGLAQSLTALPGSSRWFDTGFVTYSNEAKQRLLSVPPGLLAAEGPGAVSEETVRAMAAGAVANSRARLAVAVSGIAGPDGGSRDKPVGTVWLAWHWGAGEGAGEGEGGGRGEGEGEGGGRGEGEGMVEKTRRFLFEGDREAVRRAAVAAALEGCLEMLQE